MRAYATTAILCTDKAVHTRCWIGGIPTVLFARPGMVVLLLLTMSKPLVDMLSWRESSDRENKEGRSLLAPAPAS